jgi:hypothetical protein
MLLSIDSEEFFNEKLLYMFNELDVTLNEFFFSF